MSWAKLWKWRGGGDRGGGKTGENGGERGIGVVCGGGKAQWGGVEVNSRSTWVPSGSRDSR